MFFPVFGSLLSLVALIGTNYNNRGFNQVVRYDSQSAAIHWSMVREGNNLTHYYDNSDNSYHSIAGICQGLGNSHDQINVYNVVDNVQQNSLATIDWYYNLDNQGFLHLNIDTKNFLQHCYC